MTGEITLTGLVLPVGGIREKALAARRYGIRVFVLPALNLPDVDELPQEVKREMRFVPAQTLDDVLKEALPTQSPSRRRRAPPRRAVPKNGIRPHFGRSRVARLECREMGLTPFCRAPRTVTQACFQRNPIDLASAGHEPEMGSDPISHPNLPEAEGSGKIAAAQCHALPSWCSTSQATGSAMRRATSRSSTRYTRRRRTSASSCGRPRLAGCSTSRSARRSPGCRRSATREWCRSTASASTRARRSRAPPRSQPTLGDDCSDTTHSCSASSARHSSWVTSRRSRSSRRTTRACPPSRSATSPGIGFTGATPTSSPRTPRCWQRIRAAYAHAERALRLPLGGGFDAFRRVEPVPFIARRSARGAPTCASGSTSPRPAPWCWRRSAGTAFAISIWGRSRSYGTTPSWSPRTSARHAAATTLAARTASGPREIGLPPSVRFVDERAIYASGYRYEDLVRAVDIVATKPGYGIIAECIANDTALLYTSRGRFAEYDVMVREMPRYLRCGFISNRRPVCGRVGARSRRGARTAPPVRAAPRRRRRGGGAGARRRAGRQSLMQVTSDQIARDVHLLDRHRLQLGLREEPRQIEVALEPDVHREG